MDRTVTFQPILDILTLRIFRSGIVHLECAYCGHLYRAHCVNDRRTRGEHYRRLTRLYEQRLRGDRLWRRLIRLHLEDCPLAPR